MVDHIPDPGARSFPLLTDIDAIATDAWTQARQRFIQDLDPQEKALFINATFGNIVYGASAAQKCHEADSKSRAVAAKLDVLFAGIDQWGKALDVFSTASAKILCPLWGSLRVLIHLSSEFTKYFDVLVDMFAQIGDVIPRFQTYEKLFPSHLRLTQALSNVYLDVMLFCTMVKKIFKKAKRNIGRDPEIHPCAMANQAYPQVVNVRIILKVAWQSVEKQFGKFMGQFHRHKESVDKEAGISNLIEEGQAREFENRTLLKLEKQKQEEERIRLLSMLSSVQWEKPHWKALESRHEGTGTWIFATDVYISWEESLSSQCMYCYGIPGCGKTILTAGIIEALSQIVSEDIAVAYFYCDYADSKTLELASIVGTLIQQLLITKPAITESIASRIRSVYGDGLRQPSAEELFGLICYIIGDYNLTYIIIDGIDETSPDTQNKILDLITAMLATPVTTIKVFFSSRDNARIFDASRRYSSLKISNDCIARDIDAYVDASVMRMLSNHPVIQTNPILIETVEHELKVHAQGMFLWVYFQIVELSDCSHSEHSFKATLRDLPIGLTETYERISNKIAQKSSRQVVLATKVFNWTTCAKRPLTLKELQEAIAVEPGDKSWNKSKIPTDRNGKRFLEACAPLVVIDEADNTVRLAHHTVAQYLGDHGYDRVATDRALAEICLTYLNFADFEMQVTISGQKSPIVRWDVSNQAPFFRILQLLDISRGIYDFLSGIYNRRSRRLLPDVDYMELLKRVQKDDPSAPFEHKYQLLSYVKRYWIWHTKTYEDIDTKTWSRFRDMVFSKQLMFDFRPWGKNQGPAGLPHLTVFLWALEAEHKPLLTLLREISPLKRYLELDTTSRKVERFVTEGPLEVSELLLRECSRFASNEQLMHRALYLGQYDILKAMLIKCRGHSIDRDNFLKKRYTDLGDPLGYLQGRPHWDIGLQAMHKAAYEGDLQLLNLLHQYGADINGNDSALRTPLFYACHASEKVSRGDWIAVVRALLKLQASISYMDILGETALQSAMRQDSRDESIVRILLAKGADVHHKNLQNESIFETAIWHAPPSVLQLLIEHGLDLEDADYTGCTPLLRALKRTGSSERQIETLIASGANASVQDNDGLTTLHAAADTSRSARIIKCLLKAGADMNVRDSSGQLAIDVAVARYSKETVQTFSEFGIDLNNFDSRWEPALIRPILHGSKSMVKILVAGGADPNTMDFGYPPKSALTCAVIYDQLQIVEVLVANGANITQMHLDDQYNPIYWALQKTDPSMLRLLLEWLKPTEHSMDQIGYLWNYVSREPHLEWDHILAEKLMKLNIPRP